MVSLSFRIRDRIGSKFLCRNVEEIVKDAYAWLAGKYQEGDQIYLFGWFGLFFTNGLPCDDELPRVLSRRISSQDFGVDDIRGTSPTNLWSTQVSIRLTMSLDRADQEPYCERNWNVRARIMTLFCI